MTVIQQWLRGGSDVKWSVTHPALITVIHLGDIGSPKTPDNSSNQYQEAKTISSFLSFLLGRKYLGEYAS